jgi:hypothetical protein
VLDQSRDVLLVFDDQDACSSGFRGCHPSTVVNGGFRAVTAALNVGYR